MTTYRLDIDGGGAEAGSQRIVKSFEAIKAAADRMEGGVSAAAKKASASFSDLQRNARPVSEAAISSLKQLSAVFSTFKAPSDAAVRNTIIFLQGLKSVGSLNLGRVTGLASLLSAISGYKGPSPNAGKNTLTLLNALRFVGSFSNPRGLSTTLAALSSFKGPSAAAARNVTSLLTALNSFKAGPGMAATVRALEKIVSAANAARTSLNSLKGAGPSGVTIKTGGPTASGLSGMIKNQNLLSTAILRTQTAWNALGGILAGRAIINASNDIIKINAQLTAATGSAAQAKIQFQFVQEFSQRMGLDVRTAAESFGFFLGSVKGTNLTLRESREIFAGFSTAARALQLSTADVDGVFRALGQMMSKGKIQAEELRGQLGDRLPGAFARFAVALHMTKPGELDQALKKGTISADKMKNAILSVAQTLGKEFAPSAALMAKTVDAAFNRMKNAFTFAASDLGKSGLNDALIQIMNTAANFLQSGAFSGAMKDLGAAFKFLGDHLNSVVYIVGTLAVSGMLKWVASIVNLTRVMEIYKGLQAANAVANLAAATSGAATSVGVLSKAWMVLNAVIRANIFIIVAAAIVALITYMNQLGDSTTDTLNAIDKKTSGMADAQSIYQAYIDNVLNSKKALDDETDALIRNAQAAAYKNKMQLGQLDFSVSQRSHPTLSGWLHGQYNTRNEVGGQEVSSSTIAAIKMFTDKSGKFQPGMTAGDFARRIAIRGAMEDPRRAAAFKGSESFKKALDLDIANTLNSDPKTLGFDPLEISKRVTHVDWTQQKAGGPGITGAAIAKTPKTKHGGKSAAEKAQDDISSAIDQAMNGLTDLETRAKSTSESIGKLLSGSFDKAGAAAHIAAVDQEKSFEDAIKGPENKIKGVIQLAKQLGLDVSGQTIADQYESAKQAVIDYAEERQVAAAEAKKDEQVATDIIGLRQDNDVARDALNLLNTGKVSQAEYNKQLEIENALVGVSIKNRPALRKELSDEIDERERLKRALELTNAQRDYENQVALDKALTPMYQSGMKSEDIDYYREMIQLRQQLINDGWTGDELQRMINLHGATLNEARGMKLLTDEYEKASQSAADMADAIVGGFRDGIDAGDDFLDIFKNIFKQLGKIIMDFVLYNPLKQYLQQTLTQVLAPQSTNGFGGVGSPGGGTVSSYSTGGGLIGSVVSAVTQQFMGTSGVDNVQMLSNNGPAASGRFNYQNGVMAASSGGVSVGQDGSIIVTGGRNFSSGLTNASIPSASAQPVNILRNLGTTLKASQDGFKAFTSFLKGGKGAASASQGISGAIGAAGTAFAMYQTGNQLGKGIAKALGGGFRTQAVAGGIAGGAAAGFSLGGPVGAAVGAVVGGVLGFLKKKPKVPSSYGSVTVSDLGVAGSGPSGYYGKTDATAGQAASGAAVKMFNDFALQYGARLASGNYGTFGSRVFDKKVGAQQFYSTLGVDRKGKPIGRKGVDWITGTDSQLQAFSLIKQFQAGLIKNLTTSLATVMRNTKATDMEGLQADLAVGQAYDQFVKGSFNITDVSQKIMDLNDAFYKLKQQSVALGLSEDKLNKARGRIMAGMKDDFNFQISQGILGFTNPALAAYNDLVKEYHDAVETAMAVGGNLADVEKYYGLKRADIIKQWSETANNGLVAAARDLYNQLTASSSSPLNAQTVFGNARGLYSGLIGQFGAGDFTNVDQLTNFASNYLDAARTLYGSSTDYFDIFKQVTDQLSQYSGGVGVPGSTTTVPTIPDLPSLDSMVQDINANSLDMIDAMGTVGQAVMEGSTSIVDAIQNLAIALGAQIPATSPTPTGPTAGGTGVNGTGGTSPSSPNVYVSPTYPTGGLAGGYGGLAGGFNRDGLKVQLL